MIVLDGISDLRSVVREWRGDGCSIAFVPTMGNLHTGHLALVEQAGSLGDRVVASIFVNPLQFGPGEDFVTYPRTLDADRAALEKLETDLLFIPDVQGMYPDAIDSTTRVDVPALDNILCGAHRPGFFTGVATVVAKLFNMVQPDTAVFGEKDYQQLLVIRQMVKDLSWPIEVAGVPTVREPDGLAMSSRNGYLTPRERSRAPELYRILCDVAGKIQAGESGYPALESKAMESLSQAGFRPDYVSIRCATTLAQPEPGEPDLVILAAAWMGTARLIDNVRISAS